MGERHWYVHPFDEDADRYEPGVADAYVTARDPALIYDGTELVSALANAFVRLGLAEQIVVDCRFGLNGPPLTLQETGDILELTRERVRQIEAKALKRLRWYLAQRRMWRGAVRLPLPPPEKGQGRKPDPKPKPPARTRRRQRRSSPRALRPASGYSAWDGVRTQEWSRPQPTLKKRIPAVMIDGVPHIEYRPGVIGPAPDAYDSMYEYDYASGLR